MDHATVYTMIGDIISEGLQPGSRCDEAIHAAQAAAEERGAPVVLHDYDGYWIVRSSGPATMTTPDALGWDLDEDLS